MGNNIDWMYMPRRLPEFETGVIGFLNASFDKASRGGQICCPCKKCQNRYWHRRDEVFDHLKGRGFVDKFRDVLENESRVQEGLNEDAKKFYKLVEEGKQELFPGCRNFSKLSFVIRLLLYKTLYGLSNVAFDDLLQLLKEMIPEAKIPTNFYEAKNIIKDLGLDYKKIHACPNDCMLYWKEYEHDEVCHICHTSKWKKPKEKDKKNSNKTSTVPAKVVWHFPLKPRLQRLFMCAETAKYMKWHAEERPKDGNLRHPADGQSWKEFDSLYPHFAKEIRNVRLGLSSDGFNPFRTTSIAHSTWPVVLVNYNLPPWMSMKQEYFMLSLLIPGPDSPGNNIDIYLQPLVEELKELWIDGLETYDKSKDETFKMHATLMWTISDFPDFWMRITLGDVIKVLLNGKIEQRLSPKPLSGVQALRELSNFENFFGKTHKKKNDSTCPWKKRSIFFELPYWQFNACRHNLDVMHIEKNVCDNLIGTLLDINGKTKDHAKARFDIMEMGIKERLHPELSEDGKHVYFQNACFSMSSKEKDIFCRALKEVKLPYGCASDITRCVRSYERKVSGYKSHDAHILLHYLLQVTVRKSLPKHVSVPLIRLGAFFRKLCMKVIKPQDLDQLQLEIVEILCELEKIFLPAFFDIMVHLPIHLVNEVRLCGPVHYRWMFPIERYLCKLKSYVRNKSRPEGSIAEGYMIEECLTFCSRYTNEVKTRLTRGVEDFDVSSTTNESSGVVFVNIGHPLGGKKRKKGKVFTLHGVLSEQAHGYALFKVLCTDQDDTEEDGAEDDESEDSENMEFEIRENGMEKCYSGDYAENEDDELVHEETRSPRIEEQTAPPTIKKRGPTMMHGVHVRELKNCEVIICNKYGQPIGPSTKEKDTVGEFSRFLGTIARTYSYAPLNCISWHKVSHKERMWEYVLEKYIVPENAKSWVIKSIGAAWRVYKCRVKKDHFYDFKDNKTRWKNRPKFIPKDDFLELLRLWSRKEVMNRCLRARDARMSQKNMHTAGPKSFARIYEEMTNEDPNKEPPTLTQMFERTRKRTEGNAYVDSYDDTAKKIEQMKNFKPPEDESGSVDPYLAVMSKEYDGHRRLYGRGVTNKLIKKVACGDGSYMVPDVLMESIKSSLEEEKNKVVDMRKELEVEHEKKKLELEEEHEKKKAELEAMRQDLNNQRDKIVEEAVQKLIEKLPSKLVRKFLA